MFTLYTGGLNVAAAWWATEQKDPKTTDTHWGSVRGWLTHFLISLLPKWVRVWSSTHSRLPFTRPSVCHRDVKNNNTGFTLAWRNKASAKQSGEETRAPTLRFKMSSHLIVEDLQVPEGSSAEIHPLWSKGQTLERAERMRKIWKRARKKNYQCTDWVGVTKR